MANTLTRPIKVDSSIVPKLAEWFRAGRGVRVWENHDLSSGNVGHKVYTPADNSSESRPGWQYQDMGAILPADLVVETFTPHLTFEGTAKRRYWGMDVSDATRAKADRLADKNGGESWCFTFRYDYGRTVPIVQIGRMVETPFPDPALKNADKVSDALGAPGDVPSGYDRSDWNA